MATTEDVFQNSGGDMVAQFMHPIKIFYCYAHEDDALREQLARHLSPLRRLRDITGWFDRDVQAGANWERESGAPMDTSSIILLLISADFMASDYWVNQALSDLNGTVPTAKYS